MTRDPFLDETEHVVEQTLRQLEHKAGACRCSAIVLTLEGVPEQAAAYLARAAQFEIRLGQLRRAASPAFPPDGARPQPSRPLLFTSAVD
jgi:hypothetical protein